MKQLFNYRKSKLLLLTLLTMIVGTSPAWAQVTESFEDVTLVDPDTYSQSGELSNGWICVSSSGEKYSTGIGTSDSYKYYIGTRGYNSSSKSLGSIASNSNSYYMVIPVLMSGDITFQMCTNSTSSYTYGYVKIHKVSDNGDGTYTINSTALSTQTKSGSSSYTWAQKTVSLGDEETMIAICAYRAFIDDFTYTPYVEGSCKKPKTLTASNIMFDSADLSWTEGEEGQDTWQVVYSTDANFDKDAATPINVNSTSYSFTGLDDNTTYYVAVRSYCGAEDQSAWTITSFKTPLAPITSFPWSEDFNSLTIANTIPDGWDNSVGTTTSNNYKWCYNTSTSGNGATNGTGHDGKCIRFDSYNNSSNYTNFLKTPIMNFPTGAAMQLKFWYKNPAGGDFSVYISNDGGATYTTELATGLTGASSWTEKVIDIPSEFVNNVVIVFKGTSNWGSGDAYIYLDDVLVKENAAYAMSISGDDVVNNTIAFGEVKNTSSTKTFTISNDGASTLAGVSVVSSDATVFTVSDTNFDIEAGETKDITVRFVKGVVGEYSETVTISQTNLANDVVLTVTGSYATPSVANMAVKVGDEAVGETVAFGNVGKQTTKTITIANTGEADLVISSITSSNTTDFTISPATLTVHGGESETFTVTFVYPNENPVLNAEKTANITVTASNEGIDPVSFAVTGTRVEMWSEDFSGNALPEGWETTSTTYWTFADGVAKGTYQYSNYYLTTPSLTVEEGASLSFDVCANTTYVTMTIEKQLNNGTWTSCKDISYSSDFGSIGTGVWKTFTIDGLESGNYKFRFNARGFWLDNFEGFKRNMNDPKMGIYSDAECTAAVATSVSQNFGFATETQTATYYIKNDGTGTMTLSLGDAPDGITQTLDKTSVTAGEHATLTITMPAANKGYNGGNVVVTATDLGTFTVAVSGVIVDDTKMNLDFSTATIPTTWTTNSWSKNASGYVEVGYSSSPVTMQTSNLTAAAGEDLVVIAKQSYTSSSYSFGVKYKKTDAESWSDLIPAANIGTNYVMLHGTIAEAGTYQLQFNGQYTQIQRIYGLTEPQEPVMVVYDGEEPAAATYNFGNVSDEADATWTLTVKNEGKADLTGLAAALTGDDADHYDVEVSETTLAENETATITVKQLKDNLGAHNATLTISATGLESKEIALSGKTYDHTKMFMDFEDGNFPATWINAATNTWTINTQSGNKYLRQYRTSTSVITTQALTVETNEILTFDAKSEYSDATLTVRYTNDGGLTWTDCATYTYNNGLTGTFDAKTINGIPAGTVMLQFDGMDVGIDNIYGFTPTTAPMLALTEGSTAVANGSTKEFGSLTAQATATYTLTNNGNGAMVSTVATTGVATAAISGEAEGVTISENTVTLAAGKSATITLTMPYEAPFGEKAGAMTITTEGWVGDFTVNYTATTVDPTAVFVDFAGNSKPEGWYSNGWTYTSGYAANSNTTSADFITSKLTVAGTEDILGYEARAAWDNYGETLTVSYSTDRKNWTDVATLGESDLNATFQTFQISGLAAGDYYLKFSGSRVYVDNILGWHYATPVAEHDFYEVSTTMPTTSVVPGSEYTATVNVVSLRADETVTAQIWMQKGYEEAIKIAELTEQTMTKDVTKAFELTGNMPATEGTYQIWATVWNENGAITTDKLNIEVAHIRTLEITEFTRTSDEEATADDNNEFDATFTVTVTNTGTTELTAEQVSASILLGAADGEVQLTTNADAALAVDASVQLTLTGKVSAGAGGEVSYYAKENLSNTVYATPQTVTVTAQAALFAIDTDGSTQDFGLNRVGDEATKTYTITNNGTKALVVSFDIPEGFSMTGGNTIKFTDTQNWGDIHVYYWNDGPNWPGNAAIYNGQNEFSQNQYLFVVPEGTEGIIFNGNGRQTVDIMSFDVEGYYPENSMDGGHYNVSSWGTAPTVLTIAAGESAEFSIVMDTEATGKKSGTVTLTTNAADVASFEIPVKGHVIGTDTWVEEFTTEIPASWTNNSWEWNSGRKAAYSGYAKGHTLMTPRLAAEKDEELTFEVFFPYSGEQLKVQYSTDKTNWTDVETYSSTSNDQTFEGSFIAPATGNYYLKFGDSNSRYVYIDNFIGFKLNIPEHDTEIAASNVPTTGTQYATYTATVTLKENVGKAEEITAKLYVDNEEKDSKAEIITANGQTVVTLTWTPDEVIENAVKAYIKVTGTGIDLETEKVDLTIAAPYTLDEMTSESTVTAGTYEALVLNRTFIAGWNTVCLPFDISNIEEFFGADARVYNFTGYEDEALQFTEVTTTLEASYPYIVYVKTAITTPYILHDITIESSNNSGWYRSHNDAYFRGTYAPMAAGSLEGKYGVSSNAKIAKGDENTFMKGFRGYIELPSGASARLVFFDEDGTTTTINAVDINKQLNGESVYNLNGQRIETMKKGNLYIIDGKKTMVK